jgi:hypothetical protein
MAPSSPAEPGVRLRDSSQALLAGRSSTVCQAAGVGSAPPSELPAVEWDAAF